MLDDAVWVLVPNNPGGATKFGLPRLLCPNNPVPLKFELPKIDDDLFGGKGELFIFIELELFGGLF